MYRPVPLVAVVLASVLASCTTRPPPAREPSRSMGVSKGPELVFPQPVEALLPLLAGARATGENGRVGGELVFWSYRLADGRDVLLTACARLDGVDCEARTRLVCPAGSPDTLQTLELSGEVRQLQCRPVGQAAPGDLHPNCSDTEFTNPLAVAVLSCP